MGLVQIRFEDAASAATVYGLWDDAEIPDLSVVVAALPDVFRAQADGPACWPGWRRALEACRAVEDAMPEAPLADRFAEALRRTLAAGGAVPAAAPDLAGLLLAFDADYFRPYPDEPDPHGLRGEHGTRDGASVVVRIAAADFGFGPETLLAVLPAPCADHYFNWSDDGEDAPEGASHWYGRADFDLDRRARALAPFGQDVFAAEQEAGKVPRISARLDAAAVATAYATLLGMPLPVHVPLHGPLRPRAAWTPDHPQRPVEPVGDGWLHVRFRRTQDGGGTTVTLRRRGGPEDLPAVVARVAALPLLPLALEASDDRLANRLHETADWCEKAEFANRDHFLGSLDGTREGSLATRVRKAERYALGCARPNRPGTAQGYASMLFAAEPGLWSVLPDGAVPPAEPDVEVRVADVMPPNSRGGWVFHSSDDPAPTAHSPATHVTRRLAVVPAGRHRARLAADPAFAAAAALLGEWRDALAPFRFETFAWDAGTGALSAAFDLTFLASVHARVAGLPLPERTPFGPLPDLGPYSWRAQQERYGVLEQEWLLNDVELAERERWRIEQEEVVRRARDAGPERAPLDLRALFGGLDHDDGNDDGNGEDGR